MYLKVKESNAKQCTSASPPKVYEVLHTLSSDHTGLPHDSVYSTSKQNERRTVQMKRKLIQLDNETT